MYRASVFLLFVGCAQTQPARPDPPHDFALAIVPVDLASPDFARAPDRAPADLDVAAPDLAPPAVLDGSVACTPKVNEILTSVTGYARWEFVELYNPCGDLSLDGWSLVYRSALDTNPVDAADSATLVAFGQVPFAHGHFLVYAGPDYAGAADGSLGGNGLADDGAVGLRDPGGRLVDSVAYGAVDGGNAFIEGSPAGKPARAAAPGKSMARRHDGVDSGDNAADFTIATPSPGTGN